MLLGYIGQRGFDTRTTQPAIAIGITIQILLVIVLGPPEGTGRDNLGGDIGIALNRQPVAVIGPGQFRRCLLAVIEIHDQRAVLRAHVIALAVALGRIVVFPEYLQKSFIADARAVVDNAHHLGMTSRAGTNLFVAGIFGMASGKADLSQPDSLLLPEQPFDTPVTAHAKNRLVKTFWHFSIQRPAKDPVKGGSHGCVLSHVLPH